MPQKGTSDFENIAFATIVGAVWGQIDPDNATERIFRPYDNTSWAESLVMIVKSASLAGLIDVTSDDELFATTPEWASRYYTYARKHQAVGDIGSSLHEKYPTREEIGKLIVEVLGIRNVLKTLPDLSADFTDKADFSSSEYYEYAKTLKLFGIYFHGESANPQAKVLRSELAAVITNMFLMPRFDVTMATSVKLGESFSISLNSQNSHVVKIGSDYLPIDNVQNLETAIVFEDKVYQLNAPIATEGLLRGEKNLLIVAKNEGVYNFIVKRIILTKEDRDEDGMEDENDPWPDDQRYQKDVNANGIPDKLDALYNLESYNATQSVVIDGVSVSIAKIIEEGGYSSPKRVSSSINPAIIGYLLF